MLPPPPPSSLTPTPGGLPPPPPVSKQFPQLAPIMDRLTTVLTGFQRQDIVTEMLGEGQVEGRLRGSGELPQFGRGLVVTHPCCAVAPMMSF